MGARKDGKGLKRGAKAKKGGGEIMENLKELKKHEKLALALKLSKQIEPWSKKDRLLVKTFGYPLRRFPELWISEKEIDDWIHRGQRILQKRKRK